MTRWLRSNRSFQWAVVIAVAATCIAGSACSKPPPEPTKPKEERRLQEKEMMQREMRNE